ncbi:GNAT family N-acetyltransferase [Desulfospira joergensenii]|uniref:GNAT family N-acetyltransferase n=1 Tax=Desulfospira joergensenii TaxID=53329 RepID=UPI0004051C80|nr:GNAT family N-acetyltransferase [Desulfospira joergensenii]
MVDYIIDQAKLYGINRLVVYSHTDLAAAINLYYKKGFRAGPKTNHHNNRANIKMEPLLGAEPKNGKNKI